MSLWGQVLLVMNFKDSLCPYTFTAVFINQAFNSRWHEMYLIVWADDKLSQANASVCPFLGVKSINLFDNLACKVLQKLGHESIPMPLLDQSLRFITMQELLECTFLTDISPIIVKLQEEDMIVFVLEVLSRIISCLLENLNLLFPLIFLRLGFKYSELYNGLIDERIHRPQFGKSLSFIALNQHVSLPGGHLPEELADLFTISHVAEVHNDNIFALNFADAICRCLVECPINFYHLILSEKVLLLIN